MNRLSVVLLLLSACALPFPETEEGKTCQANAECPPAQRCHPVLEVCFQAVPACASEDDLLADGTVCSGDGICLSGSCETSRCGDGFVDTTIAGEACDDGNDDDTDACVVCQPARCGDGALQVGVEVCDDGNLESGDGCRDDCGKIEVCGDGVVDRGEACDDANANGNDGCDGCGIVEWNAQVITGFGPGDGVGPATALEAPRNVAVDQAGNVYVAGGDRRIWRIDTTGAISIVVGTGENASSGDDGPASNAAISTIFGMGLDARSNLYFSDLGVSSIRVVDREGVVRRFAGSGVSVEGEDHEGVPALEANINPFGVAVAPDGRVFFTTDQTIWVIGDDGVVRRFAGNGQFGVPSPDGTPALEAILSLNGSQEPIGLRPDGAVCWATADSVRCVEDDGTISTASGPAPIDNLFDFAFASDALLLVNDDQLLRFDGALSVVAGADDAPGLCNNPFVGDGGDPIDARFSCLRSVAVGPNGAIYLPDNAHNRLRVIQDGVVDTVMGNGLTVDAIDNVPLTSIVGEFGLGGALFDPEGRLVVIEANGQRALRLEDGRATTLVATRLEPPLLQLIFPRGGTFDAEGRFVFGNLDTIYRVEPDGSVVVIAGANGSGSAGDGGLATDAQIDFPTSLGTGDDGSLYIGTGTRVRRIGPDGIITTFAGGPDFGYAGDGGLATDALLRNVADLVVRGDEIVFSDSANNVIRRVDAAGIIDTIAGDGQPGQGGDGGLATAAQLDRPSSIAFDSAGRMYIATAGRIRVVEGGVIETFAGDGLGGPLEIPERGDGGLAAAATFATLHVEVDAQDRLHIGTGSSIRRIEDGTITTLLGGVDPLVGPFEVTRLTDPAALFAIDANTVFLASAADHRVLRLRFDLSASDVVAGYPQGFPIGADPVQAASRARFAELLEGASGLAFDGERTLFVSERDEGRVVAMDMPTLSDPSTYTLSVFRAGLNAPTALAIDGDQLLVVDTGAHVVRALALDAADDELRYGVEDAPGIFPGFLNAPAGVVVGDDGAIFISDSGNHRVLRLTGDDAVTVIGTGEASSSGDGEPASDFPVHAPAGLAIDSFGNLLVTSSRTLRLLSADDDGAVLPSAAVLTLYGATPRATFPENVTRCLGDVTVRDVDRVLVADRCAGYLIELTATRP